MAPNSFIPLNFKNQDIPVKAIAAFFQKDPAVLIAHKTNNFVKIEDLKLSKIMISPDTRVGFWRFLKVRFKFDDKQIAPYTFNLAPFLANKDAVQQGYLTSEPYLIKRSGIEPKVFLLADSGYSSYAGIIQTRNELISKKPEIIQRFINASILGWYSFLYDDPTPAFKIILKNNTDMTINLLENAHKLIKSRGLVDSEDTKASGIGMMTHKKWERFFNTMILDNLYDKNLNYKDAYTLEFVNKGVGLKYVSKD